MNELEYLEIQVAAQRLGAILVPLNYRLAVPELDYIVRSSGARLLIHGPGYEVTAKELGVGDNLHLGPTGHGDSYDEALAEPDRPRGVRPPPRRHALHDPLHVRHDRPAEGCGALEPVGVRPLRVAMRWSCG